MRNLSLTVVMLLLCPSTGRGAPATHDVAVSPIFMNTAWYFGETPDGWNIDATSGVAYGVRLAYFRPVVGGLELGTSASVHTNTLDEGPGGGHAASEVLLLPSVRYRFAFARDSGSVHLGVKAGGNLLRYERHSYWSADYGVGLGGTVRLNPTFSLLFEVDGGVAGVHDLDDIFIIRVGMLSVGLAYRATDVMPVLESSQVTSTGPSYSLVTEVWALSRAALPLFAFRFAQPIGERIELEGRVGSAIGVSGAGAGLNVFLVGGPTVRAHAFARGGCLVGWEDGGHPYPNLSAGVGVSGTRSNGLYWFAEGGPAFFPLDAGSDEDSPWAAQVSLGVGVRK